MRTLIILAALALCGCSDKPKEAASDFGAAQTARFAVDAERACAAAGFDDLPSCAADAPAKDARISAKAALSMAESYRLMCSADLGTDRCDGMLMMAYYSAVAKK